MNAYELKEAINNIAPFSLSEQLKQKGHNDNSGVICEGDGDKILCTLDLTKGAVDYAIKNGFKLILTHHPAIYNPIYSVTGLIAECVRNNIGIVSAHLNADVAENGVDYYFAETLGADLKQAVVLQDGNYGRLFEVQEQTLQEYAQQVAQKLNCKNICVFGDKNGIVKKVASFCGAGIDQETFNLASMADVIVSADIKYNYILQATQNGQAVIMPTHFATENYPFKKFCINLSNIIKEKVFYYEEDTLL